MEITELSNLDQFVRNIINETVGLSVLSKDLFYTANKNGGIGLRLPRTDTKHANTT
jgi:hypothetical protein